MNTLKVPFITSAGFDAQLLAFRQMLINEQPTIIHHTSWPTVGLKPEVSFFIAYSADAIFLKYQVKEKFFKASYKVINDPVYKDSCVEFFIGFDAGENYYNLEFNAWGTALVAYGSPAERNLLDAELINHIKTFARHKVNEDKELPFEWELTLAIPFSLFCHHPLSTLKSMNCRANFYKCGDDLPEPHYLSWNEIFAEKADFHLPRYFGQLIFK